MEESSENGPRHSSPGGGADLISALPEDLLLQVLERLDSVRAAAGTSLLSRWWRGLWTRLPKVTVTLHDVPFVSIEPALRHLARSRVCHYLLDIRVPGQDDRVAASSVSSLLSAAAGLSPVELLFTLPRNFQIYGLGAELPSFRRATSIELRAWDPDVYHPWGRGRYPLLERLSLSGCYIYLATFIPRCPRLRVLSAVNSTGYYSVGLYSVTMTVHSASLQELVVEDSNSWIRRVDVQAPVLKQLAVSFHARGDLRVSVLVPMVEKVSWRCSYTRAMYGIGIWGLLEVSLKSADRPRQTDSRKDACSQLPIVNVLSLHICTQDSFSYPDEELRFPAEINKHMITNFSSLSLHLRTTGHVFGAFVLRLLGMDRIGTSIGNLKIVLLRSEEKDTCQVNCLCNKPKDWRTQTISLADLENMEIEGVNGEDHEFDFLGVIFRCAPVLKRMTVSLADGVTPRVSWCTKINDIFMAYPFVECSIDLCFGSTFSNQTCAST